MPSRSMVSRAARAVGNHAEALGLQLEQCGRGDRLDLGHDQCRPFAQHQLAQRRGVEHVQHVRPVRDLHGGRVRVAIRRDHLDAEPLRLDRDFLAEFPGAEQQHAGAGGGEGSADGSHGEADSG